MALGKTEMQKHKAVFVGIARDNSYQLPNVMRHIEYIGQFFAEYKVIIFENDSSDATKLMLNIWQNINPRVRIISQDFFNKKRLSIKFMAEARNRYLKALYQKEYNAFDTVIVINMDMIYGIDIRGIQDSFSKIAGWDAVCSNGILNSVGNIYDVFAFRDEAFPYGPVAYKLRYAKDYWAKENISAMRKIYPPNSGLVRVDSCFGGFAIYKRKLFKNCFYDSIEDDCEHVYLHNCMRSKHHARIFMSLAQIIRYSHYHGPLKVFFNSIFQERSHSPHKTQQFSF